MYVPLPNLDDRRWADLMEEGRALIPVYSPLWTNQNYANPGITLMELYAWAAEADIYRINRVTDAERRLMLALVGIHLDGPQPARVTVGFALRQGTGAVHLPAGIELDSIAPGEPVIRFRTLNDVWVQTAQLGAVLVSSGPGLRDATADWQNGKPLALFGEPPLDNAAAYFGFTAIDPSQGLTLAFSFANPDSDEAARQRLIRWQKDRSQACTSPLTQSCSQKADGADSPAPPHHSAVVVWEAQTAIGVWSALQAEDNTRSMTLGGVVDLHFPSAPPPLKVGRFAKSYQWVRARLASGSWDAPPTAATVAANAVRCEQAAVLVDRWVLATGLAPKGTVPAPGTNASIAVEFNPAGEVASLDFSEDAAGRAQFRFLQLDASSIALEALRIGQGDGAPNQWFPIRELGLADAGFRVFTSESGMWREWRRGDGFTSSGPADLDFTLDAGAVTIRFGDGQNGRVPPIGSWVVVAGSAVAGLAGNVAARSIGTLDEGIHNIAALGDVQAIADRLSIENPSAAAGGLDAETEAHAEGRAVEAREEVLRAVTAADCEQLALNTPGTQVARAVARADLHPAFPCFEAPGVITLVVVPDLPGPRPTPSDGLLGAVRAWVGFRRVLGTRIEVTGPEYLEVAVEATVTAGRGESKAAIQLRVVAALNAFFDALHGGPDHNGWPLGRNVYMSEVLQVIDETPGVDHVESVSLTVPGCGGQCGDVCLGALTLVAPGSHQITME